MGFVPPHMYILTGDKRFKADFDKEQRRVVIGTAITGGIGFLSIIGAWVYCSFFIL